MRKTAWYDIVNIVKPTIYDLPFTFLLQQLIIPSSLDAAVIKDEPFVNKMIKIARCLGCHRREQTAIS